MTSISTSPRKLLKSTLIHHPAVIAQAEHRASKMQLVVADAITAFAGSMNFVYAHIVLFAIWMVFFEASPWPTLTLVVSLEAIFLSTFVMIGQNRQAVFQQTKADHDFAQSEQQLTENTVLTREIHRLTAMLHANAVANGMVDEPAAGTVSG